MSKPVLLQKLESKGYKVFDGKWSAGCQVFANDADFEEFMSLCNKQNNAGLGDVFTYTLLKEE